MIIVFKHTHRKNKEKRRKKEKKKKKILNAVKKPELPGNVYNISI